MTEIFNFGSSRRDWNRKMEKVAPYMILVILLLQTGVFLWWLIQEWDQIINIQDEESTIDLITISLNLIYLTFEAYKIFYEQNCFHLLLFILVACFSTFCNFLISLNSNWYFMITIIVQS